MFFGLMQTVKVAAQSEWACETTTTKKPTKKTHHQKSRLALLTGNKQSAGADVCEVQVDTQSTAKEQRNNPEVEGGEGEGMEGWRLSGRRCFSSVM